MATVAQTIKSKRSLTKAKFSTRIIRRCWRCGRKHGYMRQFNICRICFGELASQGALPGITKSSW